MNQDVTRKNRQQTVGQWCTDAFGAGQAASLPLRGLRLVEEAVEAAQAAGCDRDQLHRLVDYVYSRPVGEIGQELGGVGVTVLALANAAGLDADDCEREEVERVTSLPLDHFRRRNEAKNAAGFAG